MKKTLSIVALLALGTLTACTSSTPTVDNGVKKESTSKVVQDQVVSAGKTAAVGAATGAVTEKVKKKTAKK